MTKVLVIGGGPAGLMAAGKAAECGAQTILLERNERVARKLKITGKGRCNITTTCTDVQELIAAVPVNGGFCIARFRVYAGGYHGVFRQRGVA